MKILLCIIIALVLSACGQRAASPEGTLHRRQVSVRTEEPLQSEESVPPQPVEVLIGQAETPLLDDSSNRVENINLACGAINGMVLYPGGSFSFNDAVGRRTEANGYGDAPVLVNGHKEDGCGGGVCQVSSTLYMAALEAGLQIDERHPHSHGVAYAPEGKDATVVFGEMDLAFTNNTDKIITLGAWTDGASVFSTITQKST